MSDVTVLRGKHPFIVLGIVVLRLTSQIEYVWLMCVSVWCPLSDNDIVDRSRRSHFWPIFPMAYRKHWKSVMHARCSRVYCLFNPSIIINPVDGYLWSPSYRCNVTLAAIAIAMTQQKNIDDRTGITKHRKSVLRTEFTNKMLLMSWAQHWVPDRYAQRHAPNALQFIATSVYNALQLRQSNTAHQILTIYIFMCKHCTFTSQRKMFRICSMGQL